MSAAERLNDAREQRAAFRRDDATKGRAASLVHVQDGNPPASLTVDARGGIVLHVADGTRLSPRDAIRLARGLVRAVVFSRDRGQYGTPRYHDSAAILARAASPLGLADAALRRVYGDALEIPRSGDCIFPPRADNERDE